MKRLINKMTMILTGKKGESLVESMVSLLILSILLLSISMIIITSRRIIANSTADATETQNKANKALLEKYDDANPVELILKDPDKGIHVEIPVRLSDDDTFISFSPEEVTMTP